MRGACLLVCLVPLGIHAHEGHGAATIHLHWWEYALVAAAVAALATWLSRR